MATIDARRPNAIALGAGLLAAALIALIPFAGGLDALRAAVPSAGASAAVPEEPQIAAAYRRLPLAFVPNEGQTDPKVRYVAQTAGLGVYFTRADIRLAFVKGERGISLILRFPGARTPALVTAHERLPGKVNYFVGSDPARWRSGLSTYGEVVYRDLWPGIDLAVRGRAGTLKYEFLIRPGGRVSDIRMAYHGANGLSLAPSGSLGVATPLGVLRDSRPVSYQQIAGQRVPVASRYVLEADGGYAFSVGSYDRRRLLVIDPGLAYSTFLGGSGSDTAFSNVSDDRGNGYVTGFTTSLNFPTTTGAYDVSANGAFDAFVTKLNKEGSALIYSTYLGGSEFDIAQDIDVDPRGNAYVVGVTDSSDFPTTAGAFQQADPLAGPSPEGDDGFVTKLDSSGSALVYSTYLGGAGEDSANGVRVDGVGHAYVGSSGATSAFPTTPGAFQETDPGPGDPQDAILSKLNPSGSALVFATYLGGTECDILNSMTVDAAGHIYAAGSTGSSDFPTTPGAFQPTEPGPGPGPFVPPCARDDGWLAKLDRSGSALVFATYIGGSGDEEGVIGVGVDDSQSAYVAGRTDSAADFPTTPGAYDTTYNGGFNDVFVTKFNRSGSALAYSTFLGGSGFEEGSRFQVVLDRGGRASVTGETDSSDFPTTAGAFQPAKAGGFDAFVTTLNRSGSALVYSTYLGGSGTEIPNGISIDPRGRVLVTGRTGSPNFPTTVGAYDTTFNGGGRDAFVTKFDAVNGSESDD